MLTVSGVSLLFSDKKLFEDVNLKFTPGNCYGIIGANGAGKSTFLKVLTGEMEPTAGEVSISKGQRVSVLKQDHYLYDEYQVLDAVIMGNPRIKEIEQQKDALYAKEDFSEEDGIKASELEAEFTDLNGWEAPSEASKLLQSLGIAEELHDKPMSSLTGNEKVKVYLAQALFGAPDILILDEPTNDLDISAIMWLEEFLIDLKGIVIVVSHDRHFLNKVCTVMADVDFGKITLYTGNYDFWYQSSQLALQMMRDQNKKREEKIKELQRFIERFSANASKSKQATSRKKLLDKITIDEIRPSSRKYPFVVFKPDREVGNDILFVENISKTVETGSLLKDVSFTVSKEDKIALVGDERSITMLFQILMGEQQPDSGQFRFGVTVTHSYFPKDHSSYFQDLKPNLLDWLRQYSPDPSEAHLRGFLGKMLFSGDEVYKKINVLSGGEKVRMMLSQMMLKGSNVLLLDQPTNHLDLETITALNDGLKSFPGNILLSSHDHELMQTVANRVIEVTPEGTKDMLISYEEYLDRFSVLAVNN